MKLDARKGDSGWPCYDAKRCCMVERVLWVDDETAQWGELTLSQAPPFLIDIVHKEERITIYPSRRLVIFNEVDDERRIGDPFSISIPCTWEPA
jgi:hypothetical protein